PTIWPETVQCAQFRLQHQTYPLLTKWVCAKTRDVDAHMICCRLQHHRPTSHEVGMRENLTRARAMALTITCCGPSTIISIPTEGWKHDRITRASYHRDWQAAHRGAGCYCLTH